MEHEFTKHMEHLNKLCRVCGKKSFTDRKDKEKRNEHK